MAASTAADGYPMLGWVAGFLIVAVIGTIAAVVWIHFHGV